MLGEPSNSSSSGSNFRRGEPIVQEKDIKAEKGAQTKLLHP